MNIENNIQEIPIEDIIPNRFQPRLSFNEEDLNELSDSIKQHGIIQPIVVRRLGDKFEIIAGERRYKAATQAGLSKVPVVISNIDDNKSAEVALVENIQRKNLTSIEEAKSYKNLLDRGYLTQEQLASKVGVSQSTIANKLRLLNLDPEVQDALLNEKISERHARALLTLDNKEEQRKWLKRILDERMTVRQLDIELKDAKETDSTDPDDGIPLVNINPDFDNIINNAEDITFQPENHDVDNIFNIPTNTSTIEITPQVEEQVVEEQASEPKFQTTTNKFFNFLEDEEANMDMNEQEEIFNMFTNPILEENQNITPVVEENPSTISDNNETVETLDDLDTNYSYDNFAEFGTTSPEITENKVSQTENVSTEEPLEFSPFNNNIINTSEIPLENNSEDTLNIPNIELSTPIINDETIVDPIDSIIKLDPNYEEIKKEETKTDLASVINDFRNIVEDLNHKGVYAEIEEADLDGVYQITIKIDK